MKSSVFCFLVFVIGFSYAMAQSPLPDVPTGQTSDDSEGIVKPQGSANLLEGIIEDYNYVPTGKRDPFRPFSDSDVSDKVQTAPMLEPMLPLERFDLDQLRLVGIIWGGENPKAMFLDPNDRTYIVRKNERVGRNKGYIAAIREGEVVVIEPVGKEGYVGYRTRILRLQNAESEK